MVSIVLLNGYYFIIVHENVLKRWVMEKEYIEYVIDRDYCPKWDIVLTRDMCGSKCEFYMDFELYHEQPSVKCKYYSDTGRNLD